MRPVAGVGVLACVVLAACADEGPAADAGTTVDAGLVDGGAVLDGGGDPALDCHPDAIELAADQTWLGRNFLYYVEWTSVEPTPASPNENVWTWDVKSAADDTSFPDSFFQLTLAVPDGEIVFEEDFMGAPSAALPFGIDLGGRTGPMELTLAITPGLGGDGDTVKEIFCLVP